MFVFANTVLQEEKARFVFTDQPQSWGVFLFIGLALLLLYGVVHFYRREAAPCPPWGRFLLIALRGSTILLLLWVLLGPALRFRHTRTLLPSIFLLRDSSLSMVQKDRYNNEEMATWAARALGKTPQEIQQLQPTRADIVNHVLRSEKSDEGEDVSFTTELSKRGNVRILDTATNAAPVSADTPLEPNGPGTDLAAGIKEALAEDSTSAVVLFSDGQHNARSDVRDAARQAGAKGVPLFIVGVGDMERPRNVEVADIYADGQVWKDDPFEVQALLRTQGLDEEELTLEVEFVEQTTQDGTTSEKVLQTRQETFAKGETQKRLSFSHTPDKVGEYSYTIRVKPVDNELSEEDNQPKSPVAVKILDQKAKVLLVSASSDWNYRSLQRLLTREQTIDVSCWLQSLEEGRAQQGNSTITKLPTKKEDLFEYDALILMDPNPTEFDETWTDMVMEFVKENAGGCLYIAGPRNSAKFLTGSRTGGFSNLLPVRLQDLARMELDNVLAENKREWPLAIFASNADQPIMRLHNEIGKTVSQWEELAGVYWSFPALDTKPGARLLIGHSNPSYKDRPLLVSGRYGSGHTVYMGFNSSWRWRRDGKDGEYFKRFWLQSVRYLMGGRALSGKRRGTIEPLRPRYTLGEQVTLSARLKDKTYEPLVKETVQAELELPDGTKQPIELRAIPNQPGQYEAAISPNQTGSHRLTVNGLEDNTSGAIETTFSVTLPQVEMEKTWLDRPLLRELAELSKGQYFDADEAKNIPGLIPDRKRTIEIPRPAEPLWNRWWVLATLVGLLGLEWILRKRFTMF